MSDSENLDNQIKLNDEMITNLREFFGSYLSNFLKEYRNKKDHDPRMLDILSLQDKIYDKIHHLMKYGVPISEQTDDPKTHLKNQQQIIIMIKKFFSSNSKFIKLYREETNKNYEKMNELLTEQERIFEDLSKLIRRTDTP